MGSCGVRWVRVASVGFGWCLLGFGVNWFLGGVRWFWVLSVGFGGAGCVWVASVGFGWCPSGLGCVRWFWVVFVEFGWCPLGLVGGVLKVCVVSVGFG